MKMREFYPSDEYDSEHDERRFKDEQSRSKWKWWDRHDDDDDDPPPAPAAAQLPKPVPLVDGVGLMPAA
jgi:hypothetical protein